MLIPQDQERQARLARSMRRLGDAQRKSAADRKAKKAAAGGLLELL